MEHQGFQYEFSPKEMRYFLFGKKICPSCGGKLVKHKGYYTGSDTSPLTLAEDLPRPAGAKIKKYVYYYECAACHATHLLKDLAK